MNLQDLLDRLHVVALPMRVRFRGITVREVALIDGPAGWGEFGPFPEYEAPEAAHWLAAGIESAYRGWPSGVRTTVPINATVPAVPAGQVPEVLARFPGARTAKVKVAEPGQTLADDVARVEAVRALVPTVRVDANGGWSVEEAVAAAAALTAGGPLEYLEQPCRTVPELAEVRRRAGVPVAADESIRRAEDPLAVVRAGAADIAVLKVAPLGGVRALLEIAAQIDVPVVLSSALDSAVGISAGLAAAAALPRLEHACGLGTGRLFIEDVAEHHPVDGWLPVTAPTPDPARLSALAAPADRRDWWIARGARLLGMAEITLGGKPVHTVGELPAVGTRAPDFTLTGTDLGTVLSAQFLGKPLLLNIFPSVDTPVCAASIRKFNEQAAARGLAVVCVSKDLPFALSRFCGAEGIDNVTSASAFRDSFGDDYGITIADGPMAGLLGRAVVVVGPDGTVTYTQLVGEIGSEPDYDAALAAI